MKASPRFAILGPLQVCDPSGRHVPLGGGRVRELLAVLLLVGSVAGAQVGARFASKVKPEYLRLALAVIVLLVAGRIALGLGWRPDEIYSVELS